MKFNSPTPIILAAIACLTLGATAVIAQQRGTQSTQSQIKSVNEMCPIGKRPVDPDATRVMYMGQSVGFCCGGCAEKFAAWDNSEKENFILLAMRNEEPGNMDSDTPSEAIARAGDPYMLSTCPISGGALGSMGDPIVNVYGGREVRFCCAMCVPKFEANQDKYIAKIDEQIIATQEPYYPLDTCIVSDEPFEADGSGTVNIVYNNRLIKTCCKSCAKDVRKDPVPFIKKLDAAVIEKQRDAYPIEHCLVMDDPLEEGEIVDVVYGNRLFRLCCKKCKRMLKKKPTETMVTLDKAWADQGGVPH